MSESAYKGESAPDAPPPTETGSGGGSQGGGPHLGFSVDTTYPRSIEGILKIVTAVSQPRRCCIHEQ